uniref:OCEL domain-containing protein n=1 Tax=Bubo bubo TaxID=30461 RepID=A0A8C0IBR2_BUBBB
PVPLLDATEIISKLSKYCFSFKIMVLANCRQRSFIQIPEFDLPDELDTFNFLLSDIGNDDPQESFYCVQQMDSSSGASQLSCLGLTQNKISVCATSDSYPTTKACMTQPEEESRSGSAKFIKPGGPFLGRKAQVRKAPQKIPDPVPVRKRSTPMNPANIIRRIRTQNVVCQRPYRDRVIHLLALKNYKKPELLARLQKDGVSQKDKNCLGMILHQVASLNTKDNSYSLKDYLFKDIQKDWPGYNEIDKQSLELILSSGFLSLLSQKRVLNSSFIDPLNKKKRISRLGSGIPSPLRDRLKYTAIVSYEQRQRYKNDFYAEYDEYRNLYAQMESISQKFTSLDAQRHMLSPESKEYKVEKDKTLRTVPSYSEEKRRCQYLHNKLSHIKKLIGEFDKQQEEL